MARISVAKARKTPVDRSETLKSIAASFCYYFNQYTFEEAMELPIKTMKRMLKTSGKERAKHYIELTQIARAAQAQKPTMYKSLISKYKEEIGRG